MYVILLIMKWLSSNCRGIEELRVLFIANKIISTAI